MNTMKKNNSYGMGGKSYEMGGKLSKQEAKLLKMLMTKMMGEEGMRVMQGSGMTPEAKAGDRAYFEDKVVGDPRFRSSAFNITQRQADMQEAGADRAREEEIKEGGSRSVAQALYDELSQVGMGLRGVSDALDNQMRKSPYGRGEFGGPAPDPSTAAFPDVIGAFRDAYGKEEDADKARMDSGAKGFLDARNPFSILSDFLKGSETDGLNQATVSPSRGIKAVRRGIERRERPVR